MVDLREDMFTGWVSVLTGALIILAILACGRASHDMAVDPFRREVIYPENAFTEIVKRVGERFADGS